jgi:flagellar protein FlaG
MSFDLSAVNPYRLPAVEPRRPAAAPARATVGGSGAELGPAARVHTFPASPPQEVLDEMLAAQRAVRDLYERGRELHFEMADGRLRIELRDLDGNVLKTIPGSEALEIAGGKAVD